MILQFDYNKRLETSLILQFFPDDLQQKLEPLQCLVEDGEFWVWFPDERYRLLLGSVLLYPLLCCLPADMGICFSLGYSETDDASQSDRHWISRQKHLDRGTWGIRTEQETAKSKVLADWIWAECFGTPTQAQAA